MMRSALFATVFLFACAPTQKPAPLPEVPIHEDRPVAFSTPASGDDAVTDEPAAPPPQKKPDAAAPPAADAGKAKGPTIGAPECKKVIKKFADFVMKDAGQPPVETSALESNPIFGQMLDQCQQETTKKQYDCAMTAKNRGAWEACMK